MGDFHILQSISFYHFPFEAQVFLFTKNMSGVPDDTKSCQLSTAMGSSLSLSAPIVHTDCKSFFKIVRARTYCPKYSWKIKERKRKKERMAQSAFPQRVKYMAGALLLEPFHLPFRQGSANQECILIKQRLDKTNWEHSWDLHYFGKINCRIVQNGPLLIVIITIKILLKYIFIIRFLI